MSTATIFSLDPVSRLNRDLANAAKSLSLQEVRFLVDAYYSFQRDRIRADNQVQALNKSGEPHEVVMWLSTQSYTIENQIRRALDKWTAAQPLGQWVRCIPGIGPVLAAGLMAYIPMEHDQRNFDVVLTNAQTERDEILDTFRKEADAKAYLSTFKQQLKTGEDVLYPYTVSMPESLPIQVETGDQVVIRERIKRVIVNTAGKVWSFAGIVPKAEWKKGEVRPWNAKLKTLCYKCGESFIKVSGKPDDIYGKLYLLYKKDFQAKNEKGFFQKQAEYTLKTKKFGIDTIALSYYKQGKLPPAHLHSRARRFAVRVFLSHYHAVAFRHYFQQVPPNPFAIDILGHTDWIKVPYWDPYDPNVSFPFRADVKKISEE